MGEHIFNKYPEHLIQAYRSTEKVTSLELKVS